MNNILKNTSVLTTNGFKNIAQLTTSDYLYNPLEKSLARITAIYDREVKTLSQYSYIQNSILEVNFLVRNNQMLEVFDTNFTRVVKEVSLITKNDWLFHPWVEKEFNEYSTSVDFSSYSNNFYDSEFIYFFNNSILNISKDLGIEAKAVQQLLSCEKKEYEDHLESLIKYVRENYGVNYDPNLKESGFKEFKKFITDKFVYKMNRTVPVDSKFIAFVIASINCCTPEKISTSSNSTNYVLNYSFKKEGKVYKEFLSFLSSLGVKFKIIKRDFESVIVVNNKVLFQYVCQELFNSLEVVLKSSKQNIDFFVDHLFDNSSSVTNSFQVCLDIKEIFMWYKRIIKISNGSKLFSAKEIQDDLEELESTLIVEDYGYYSKVVAKTPFDILYCSYQHISSRPSRIIHMGFTECII